MSVCRVGAHLTQFVFVDKQVYDLNIWLAVYDMDISVSVLIFQAKFFLSKCRSLGSEPKSFDGCRKQVDVYDWLKFPVKFWAKYPLQALCRISNRTVLKMSKS